MSLVGWFTDKLTGQPAGTTDASAAMGAAADAGIAAENTKELTNGDITPAQYDALTNGLAGTANSGLTAYAEADAAGLAEGAGGALLTPIDTFENGLNWEASTAGNIAGGAVALAAGAAKKVAGGFFSKIPWWIYPLVIIGVFFYLGGGGFLERKARRRLSA